MDAQPPGPTPPRDNPFDPPAAPIGRDRGRRPADIPTGTQVVAAFLILLSGAIAFLATCFPLGVINVQLGHGVPQPNLDPDWFPWVVGGAVGLVVVGLLTKAWKWWLARR